MRASICPGHVSEILTSSITDKMSLSQYEQITPRFWQFFKCWTSESWRLKAMQWQHTHTHTHKTVDYGAWIFTRKHPSSKICRILTVREIRSEAAVCHELTGQHFRTVVSDVANIPTAAQMWEGCLTTVRFPLFVDAPWWQCLSTCIKQHSPGQYFYKCI